MTKKRILFVDDEPNVLSALRRSMRPMNAVWDMAFVDSGGAALNYLKHGPCDVIVTDMRMPGMDGAELLRCVQHRFPHVVRIILSGHAEFESLLESAELAHQYLAKPCDVSLIQATIERVCEAEAHLDRPHMDTLIGSLRTVPSMPQCYFELTKVMNSPDVSLAHVAGIVSRDVGMTAKVLQLVNSAFFGLPRRVDTPLDAVKFLGIDVLRGLVVNGKVFSTFDERAIRKLGLAGIERESVIVGNLARTIAADLKLDSRSRDAALVAGMLHDVGALVLASNLPERYAEALASCREGTPLCASEQQVFGYDHAQVGTYLLTLWGMPNAVVDAVAYHHAPSSSGEPGTNALTAVHLADGLLSEYEDRFCSLDSEYLRRLGLQGRLDSWRSACKALLEAA